MIEPKDRYGQMSVSMTRFLFFLIPGPWLDIPSENQEEELLRSLALSRAPDSLPMRTTAQHIVEEPSS
jgi:hypothetical protein